MHYAHLLLSRGYTAQDDYGWIVRPDILSDGARHTLMHLFKVAYRHLNRYQFSPPQMVPLYVVHLDGGLFVLQLSQTDFTDYQSRTIYAFQGIAVDAANRRALLGALPTIIQERTLLDTIAQLAIDLHDDVVPITSPVRDYDTSAIAPVPSEIVTAEDAPLRYTLAGYDHFLRHIVAGDAAQHHLLFGAPAEASDLLEDKPILMAGVTSPKPTQQRSAKETPVAVARATDRFNPLATSAPMQEDDESGEQPFDLIAFLRSLFVK